MEVVPQLVRRDNMKKVLLLLITLILLTGCTATYNINIKDKTIEDSIKVYTDSKKVQNADKKTITEFSEKLGEWERGYEYYKREIYTTDKITGYNYTYTFNYEEYDAMSQLRKCYKDFKITNENNNITLSTSNEFLCKTYYQEIDKIEINISSEYKITESNADRKENNIHTWNINKNNYKNKPIIIKINKNIESQKEEKNNKNNNIFQLLITILFFTLILILIIRKKKNK